MVGCSSVGLYVNRLQNDGVFVVFVIIILLINLLLLSK